jgi:hypothetical protein
MNQNISKKDKTSKNRFQRFAITSLVIGISMIVVMLATFVIESAYAWTMSRGTFFPVLYYLFIFCVNSAGFISGIIGLKSDKKNMAITGITLCSLIFLPCIYITYVLLDTYHYL